MATINVSLPDLMKTWVEQQVEAGAYESPGDYICEMIRRDYEHDRDNEVHHAKVAATQPKYSADPRNPDVPLRARFG